MTISNSPPELTSIELTPDPLTTDDLLSATPYATDADGDSVTHSYSWAVNGTATGDSTATFDVSTTTRGDSITCTVTPSDGTDTDTAMTSAAATVGNALPSISSASVSPSAPTADETLTCSYSGFSDPDGDSDSSTYEWTVDGSVVGSASTHAAALYAIEGDELWTFDEGAQQLASSHCPPRTT